jgi:hypothetical protein
MAGGFVIKGEQDLWELLEESLRHGDAVLEGVPVGRTICSACDHECSSLERPAPNGSRTAPQVRQTTSRS